MSLWWMQPGWLETPCGNCGATIAPEGDPDWGLCWPCMQQETERQQEERARQEWEEAEMERHFREHPHG